jgi:hypothetical protein
MSAQNFTIFNPVKVFFNNQEKPLRLKVNSNKNIVFQYQLATVDFEKQWLTR